MFQYPNQFLRIPPLLFLILLLLLGTKIRLFRYSYGSPRWNPEPVCVTLTIIPATAVFTAAVASMNLRSRRCYLTFRIFFLSQSFVGVRAVCVLLACVISVTIVGKSACSEFLLTRVSTYRPHTDARTHVRTCKACMHAHASTRNLNDIGYGATGAPSQGVTDWSQGGYGQQTSQGGYGQQQQQQQQQYGSGGYSQAGYGAVKDASTTGGYGAASTGASTGGYGSQPTSNLSGGHASSAYPGASAASGYGSTGASPGGYGAAAAGGAARGYSSGGATGGYGTVSAGVSSGASTTTSSSPYAGYPGYGSAAPSTTTARPGGGATTGGGGYDQSRGAGGSGYGSSDMPSGGADSRSAYAPLPSAAAAGAAAMAARGGSAAFSAGGGYGATPSASAQGAGASPYGRSQQQQQTAPWGQPGALAAAGGILGSGRGAGGGGLPTMSGRPDYGAGAGRGGDYGARGGGAMGSFPARTGGGPPFGAPGRGSSRRSRSPPKESSHRARSRSPARRSDRVDKPYVVKLLPHVCGRPGDLSYLDLKRRYPKLHISTDFCRLSPCIHASKGAELARGDDGSSVPEPPIPFHHAVKFDMGTIDLDEGETEATISSKDGSIVADPATGAPTQYRACVMLMTGIEPERYAAALKAAVAAASSSKGGDSGAGENPEHLHQLIKFLLIKSDHIAPVSGWWSQEVDGGNPGDVGDESALVRTAVRAARERVGLDLSGCQTWTRVMEIHYEREGGVREVAVFLLPDVWNALPDPASWPAVWKQHETRVRAQQAATAKQAKKEQAKKTAAAKAEAAAKAKADDAKVKAEDGAAPDAKASDAKPSEKASEEGDGVKAGEDAPMADAEDKEEVEEEAAPSEVLEADAPTERCLFVAVKSAKGGKGTRCRCISLDGLLDYEEEDKDEPSFELSLFAETLHEMLQCHFARRVLASLKELATRPPPSAGRKRGRDSDAPKESKRSKSGFGDGPATAASDAAATESKKDDGDKDKKEDGDKEEPKENGDVKPKEDGAAVDGGDAKDAEKDNDKGEEGGSKKREEKKEEKKEEPPVRTEVDYDLLASFRYFDAGAGDVIKRDDLATILYSLGGPWPVRELRELLAGAVKYCGGGEGRLSSDRDRGRHARDSKGDPMVLYRMITDREVKAAPVASVDAVAAEEGAS
eukprot:jgi/Mesvir1/999/Mv17537-RA.1